MGLKNSILEIKERPAKSFIYSWLQERRAGLEAIGWALARVRIRGTATGCLNDWLNA